MELTGHLRVAAPDGVAAHAGIVRELGGRLETVDEQSTNLPAQLTSFVGRSDELDEAKALLATTSLLTLTGSAGCGKTRLAHRLAEETIVAYPDGVWWIDLGPLTQPELVPSTVARTLGLHEVPFQDFCDRVVATLRDRKALLVLDNCEHLIAACAELVDRLLRHCPSVTVVATSREPLGVAGETAWRVPSLSLPTEGESTEPEALSRFDAVRLFLDRAVKARPNFRLTHQNAAAVAEICRRLDGIPLALELAAARTRLLSPEQIAQGLADRFRLLTGGARTAVPRQQTLGASVEWSFRLLADTEKMLLRRLAVFAGSFTLDAAEAVCSDEAIPQPEILDLLGALVDKSLVQPEETEAETRYRLLETIRQYANQKLIDSDEMTVLRDAHVAHYLGVAEAGRAELEEGPDLIGALNSLDLVHGNLRAALDWALTSDADTARRMVRGLWGYWYCRALLSEGIARCEAAAGMSGGSTAWKARVLAAGAVLSASAVDPRAVELGQEAWRLGRESEDPMALLEGTYSAGSALFNSDPRQARPPLEQALSLAREMQNPFWEMRAMYGLGVVEVNSGNFTTGRQLLGEALRMSEERDIRLSRLLMLYWSGHAASNQGDLDEAESLLGAAIEEAKWLKNVQFECLAAYGKIIVATMRGDHDVAEKMLRHYRQVAAEHPHPIVQAFLAYPECALAYGRGDLSSNGEGLTPTIAFFQALGGEWAASWMYAAQSDFSRARGDLDEADRRVTAALELAHSSGNPCSLGRASARRAAIMRTRGDLDHAEDLYHEALRHFGQAGAKLDMLAVLDGLGGIAASRREYEEAARILAASANLRVKLGAKHYAPDAKVFDDHVALVRESLGENAFERAWTGGQTMTLEEAVGYVTRGRGERKRPASGWGSLTPVETDVVRLVAQGLTNPQIGERLFISPGTVKNHLSHVFAKLGIATRAELAAEAVRREL